MTLPALLTQNPVIGPWNYLSIGCGLENWYGTGTSQGGISLYAGTPGTVLWVGHGQENNNPVYFITTGSLLSPLVQYQTYYVRNKTLDTFELALSPGGA